MVHTIQQNNQARQKLVHLPLLIAHADNCNFIIKERKFKLALEKQVTLKTHHMWQIGTKKIAVLCWHAAVTNDDWCKVGTTYSIYSTK